MEVLVEGAAGDEALEEEIPGAAVAAGIFLVLGESGASRVEHRVIGGAGREVEVARRERVAGADQPGAG
jgi:hypothetical protein